MIWIILELKLVLLFMEYLHFVKKLDILTQTDQFRLAKSVGFQQQGKVADDKEESHLGSKVWSVLTNIQNLKRLGRLNQVVI